MRGAEAIGAYVGLDEQEAFDIEYWLLEEAKLQRMPKPRPLAGRIALVTGGAGGIGAATAERLAADDACVLIVDRDVDALTKAAHELEGRFGRDRIRSAVCDVTDEAQVAAAFATCAREFGGLDILVANAGIASSAPIEDTTLELWQRNYDVLAQGYFLTARAAFPLMKAQEGGSIVFIGSKKRNCRGDQRIGLCVGESGGAAPCALSRARRRTLRHPGQHGQSRRGDQGIAHLGRRLAPRTRGRARDRFGQRA